MVILPVLCTPPSAGGVHKVGRAGSYRTANVTPDQKAFNKAMSEQCVSVEWLFGLLTKYFKFILKYAKGCSLLQNAHTCPYFIDKYF